MRYLIDTCAISELSARKPSEDVRRWFASVPDEDLYLSVVTIGELRKGVDRLSEDDPLRQRLERWFSSVRSVFSGRILEFDEKMAMAWGKLVGESIRIGKTRPAIDAQLAATALINGMVLVTRNERDFEHTGVQVLNPFDKKDESVSSILIDNAVLAIRKRIEECKRSGSMFAMPQLEGCIIEEREGDTSGAILVHSKYTLRFPDGHSMHIDYQSKDRSDAFNCQKERSSIAIERSDGVDGFSDSWEEKV